MDIIRSPERAGGIVLNPRGEVLVITNELDRLTLPKGRLEPGETSEEAAVREIKEEGGLKHVTVIKELGILKRLGFSDDNHEVPTVMKHITVFLCTTEEFELHPAPGEIKKAQWVKPADVGKLLSWPEEVEFFARHRASLIRSSH